MGQQEDSQEHVSTLLSCLKKKLTAHPPIFIGLLQQGKLSNLQR